MTGVKNKLYIYLRSLSTHLFKIATADKPAPPPLPTSGTVGTVRHSRTRGDSTLCAHPFRIGPVLGGPVPQAVTGGRRVVGDGCEPRKEFDRYIDGRSGSVVFKGDNEQEVAGTVLV